MLGVRRRGNMDVASLYSSGNKLVSLINFCHRLDRKKLEKNKEEPKKIDNKTVMETVNILQNALRQAREDQAAAELDAAKKSMAAEKLSLLLEANATYTRHSNLAIQYVNFVFYISRNYSFMDFSTDMRYRQNQIQHKTKIG